jgi:hypothetical protein
VVVRERLRAVTARQILVAGYLGFLIYAYPGYLSWDAMTQLAQARRDIYTDDHPPAMAVMWHVLEHLVHGPLPMLLVGSLPLVIGMHRLFATRMSARAAAVATTLVLWFPPVGTVTAAIYKDTLMASFLVAAVPLLVARRNAWGLVLICAATAMRYNALAATLPLVVLLCDFGLRRWKRYAVALVAWVGVTVGALVVNGALADRSEHYWYKTQALMDIADTLANARDYSDAELAQLLDGVKVTTPDLQTHLRAIYKPVDFRHLDRGATQVFEPPEAQDERVAVARAWRRVIADNPGAYLRYRWDNFVMLLRLDHAVYDNAPITIALRWHEDFDEINHDLTAARVQDRLMEGLRMVSRTHLFDPYPYAILALVLVVLARRDRLAAAVLLSGLAYEAAYFLLAPTADFRYSQWMIACTCMGTVMIVARRRWRSGS